MAVIVLYLNFITYTFHINILLMDTMLIQLTNQKAAGLLHELEELHLIKVLDKNITADKPKLSDKYRGSISNEQGQQLNEHIKQMRSEWHNI